MQIRISCLFPTSELYLNPFQISIQTSASLSVIFPYAKTAGRISGNSRNLPAVFLRVLFPPPVRHHQMNPSVFPSQYPSPSAQLVNIPYKITGPAMVKILHPIPNTCPSFLNSMAGAATLLANPVIGTNAPAPPNFTIDGYMLKPVKRILARISSREHQPPAVSLSSPKVFVA